MDLWNKKDLEAPPVTTYKATDYSIDLTELSNTLKEAVSFFKNQKHLAAETALLSRCIYRMKTKFRTDKGLKTMEKTNRALLQYLRLNFTNTLTVFCELVPPKYETSTYLPTKNSLDYLLVRLQSVSKLMCRVSECAKEAAFHMESRIAIGHFWKVAFIIFALLSRIWILAKHIVGFCCAFYAQLLPYASVLKNTSFEWLPKEYEFPKSLGEWLGVDASVDLVKAGTVVDLKDERLVTEDEDLEVVGEMNANVGFRGFDAQNITFETITNKNELGFGSKKNKKIKKLKETVRNIDEEEDLLQNTVKVTKNKQTCSSKQHNFIDSLATVQQIARFIKNEDVRRENDPQNCYLNNIDKLQWNILRKNVLKTMKKGVKTSKPSESVIVAKEMFKLYII